MDQKHEEIFSVLKKYIEDEGYDCAGLELVKEYGMNILRVYIDTAGGVDLDGCEAVSRAVTEYLDTVENVMPDNYYLEVSSLGLERPLFALSDYEKFIGRKAEISLTNGKKTEATIKEVKDNVVTVIDKSNEEKVLAWSEIRRGHLIYEEEKGEKKTFKKAAKKK